MSDCRFGVSPVNYPDPDPDPVVLYDTPGISRCRSQHVVSAESTSLFHHNIYP